MAKPITVSIVGNAGPLKKAVGEADNALEKLSGSFKKVAAVTAVGVGAIAAGIGFAVKSAAEDQKAFELLSQALLANTNATKEQVSAIDEQIGAMSIQIGIADDQLRPAFANLARATGDPQGASGVHQSAIGLGDDRTFRGVWDFQIHYGLGVGPQQSTLVYGAGIVAHERRHVRFRHGPGDLRLARVDHRVADAQRLVQRHGLAAVRENDGALVEHPRARQNRRDVERRAQCRWGAGCGVRHVGGGAVWSLGGDVLF